MRRRPNVPADGQAGFLGALLNGVAGLLSEPVRCRAMLRRLVCSSRISEQLYGRGMTCQGTRNSMTSKNCRSAPTSAYSQCGPVCWRHQPADMVVWPAVEQPGGNAPDARKHATPLLVTGARTRGGCRGCCAARGGAPRGRSCGPWLPPSSPAPTLQTACARPSAEAAAAPSGAYHLVPFRRSCCRLWESSAKS